MIQYLKINYIKITTVLYHHIVYTEEANKIAISSNDDKRLQTFDKVTTYSHGTNAFKICESKMLASKNKHE